MPVAINISFGNTYGSHEGTSLLERYLDDMSNYWKSVICVGSGNEGTSAGHTSGMLKEREEQRVELGVQQREPALNVQLWKSYVDEVDISVIGPSGVRVGPISERLGTQRFRIGEQKSCFTMANQVHIRPIRRFILISSQRVLILTVESGRLC